MKRNVETWSVDRLYKIRGEIAFPEYQRQPNLWSVDKKRLLIDSILRDIDIPKLYFNKPAEGGYEVVDGNQRLWALWDFLDGVYTYTAGGAEKKFLELEQEQQATIRQFKLQVAVIEEADDEYLRDLFVRLQLGLLLVTGEKLRAATGTMKNFVFQTLSGHAFITSLRVPERRFARETLCAQISVNSFSRAKRDAFARTRYEDLAQFFREYADPQGIELTLYDRQTKIILAALTGLHECFGEQASELTNRSYILSVYLFFEEFQKAITAEKVRKQFVRFVLQLWRRLREEVSAGIDRHNRELYEFESMINSAPGERYQI